MNGGFQYFERSIKPCKKIVIGIVQMCWNIKYTIKLPNNENDSTTLSIDGFCIALNVRIKNGIKERRSVSAKITKNNFAPVIIPYSISSRQISIHLNYKTNFALKPLWVSLSGIDFSHFDTPPDGDALPSHSLDNKTPSEVARIDLGLENEKNRWVGLIKQSLSLSNSTGGVHASNL